MFGAVYTPSDPMYLRTPKAVGFPKLVSLPRASLLGGWTPLREAKDKNTQ